MKMQLTTSRLKKMLYSKHYYTNFSYITLYYIKLLFGYTLLYTLNKIVYKNFLI